MAPAVPFALLGVVQLTAVAAWLGLAGAATFPRLRRRVTPLFVLGALAMAVADAYTAARYGPSSSDPVGWLRAGGMVLMALGLTGGVGQSLVVAPAGLGAVIVPLGAAPAPAYVAAAAGLVGAVGAVRSSHRTNGDRALGALLALGLLASGVAAGLAVPAQDTHAGALAVLAARAVATVALIGALLLLARLLLVGKIVGAILAGVIAMAVGAVGVVGSSVASEVQSQESQRLLQVAQGERQALTELATRAALFAQVVAQCPAQLTQCESFLSLFSEEPNYFGVLVYRGKPAKLVAPAANALSAGELVQLAGSEVVQAALLPRATAQTAPAGPVLLGGKQPQLAIVSAVPGRPHGSTNTQIRPTFAAVYGQFIGPAYLSAPERPRGESLSLLANGKVIATAAGGQHRAVLIREVQQQAQSGGVQNSSATATTVVAASGEAPTTAFVPITAAGNDDLRIATLALSQPANEALRAQRQVLQRLFLTALIALVVVAGLAVVLAQRIAEPVRRLTVAAGRVRRGDLDARTTISSKDEVGRLSRAFDAMTASLRQATEDLRLRAATEAELRERLETVVESMSDGLVVTDPRSVVTAVNPTAAELIGREPDAILGKRLPQVVSIEDGEGRSLLERPDGNTTEGELVRGDGHRIPVRVGSAPLGDGQGSVFVVADRTREREIDRMKTEFLANISHELRTPLTPIRGYAEMLARRPDLPRDKVSTFLDEILASTEQMSRAVELLVDVAALEGVDVEPRLEAVSVKSYVDERLAAWKKRYPERAADFRKRVTPKLPSIEIDRHWVGRAFDELVDNAVKYTPRGTRITVQAGRDEMTDGVLVTVRDNGPGFDPERAAELVGDFSQADASDTRRFGGMGIGLGFVSRVATRFGLTLTVDTEPGKGSEFGLVLPVASAG
jgi:PAS domain S-box-containing protein